MTNTDTKSTHTQTTNEAHTLPTLAYLGGTQAMTLTPTIGTPKGEYPEVFIPGEEPLEDKANIVAQSLTPSIAIITSLDSRLPMSTHLHRPFSRLLAFAAIAPTGQGTISLQRATVLNRRCILRATSSW